MTDSEFFRDMNSILDEWQGRYKPSEIREVESLLRGFYKDAGKNIKNPTRFNSRVKLTPEQEEELMDIALSLQAREEDLDYYEDFYRKRKKDFGFKSMDDVAEFFETMNNFKNDAMLREIISSDQILELYMEGKQYNISREDIDKMVYLEYSLTGRTFDKLYENVYNTLSTINVDEVKADAKEASFLAEKWRGKRG